MYQRHIKRWLDFLLALVLLISFSPVLLILTVLGAVFMKGNPFFTQERPGKNEKIFKLIKFRSMTFARDRHGKPLSDDARLTRYGRLLRSTSLDELPELINILKGDMSFIGPRPLLPEYLPYYTESERRRHEVLPGLTGWAQVNGRNNISTWEERFAYDLTYVERCSFAFDLKIFFLTVYKVIKRSDILVGRQISAGRLDVVRKGKMNHDQHQEVL